jgi:hypothetical protein
MTGWFRDQAVNRMVARGTPARRRSHRQPAARLARRGDIAPCLTSMCFELLYQENPRPRHHLPQRYLTITTRRIAVTRVGE